MLQWQLQEKKIEKLEDEIDKLLDLEIEPILLNDLLDELEMLLSEREDRYKLRIV